MVEHKWERLMESGTQPEKSEPILNIVGDKVALGPLSRELVHLYLRWINDFEVTMTMGIGLRPAGLENEESWYSSIAHRANETHFTIYELSIWRPIGNTSLLSIDYHQGTAEFGIMIGEKDRWNAGFGTETARLMLDYAFTILGLRNVMLTVLACNSRAISAYERAGFKVIGRRREGRRLGRRFYDVVYMDCLSTEFQSPALHRLLPPDH